MQIDAPFRLQASCRPVTVDDSLDSTRAHEMRVRYRYWADQRPTVTMLIILLASIVWYHAFPSLYFLRDALPSRCEYAAAMARGDNEEDGSITDQLATAKVVFDR